jgi:hypothetical protein
MLLEALARRRLLEAVILSVGLALIRLYVVQRFSGFASRIELDGCVVVNQRFAIYEFQTFVGLTKTAAKFKGTCISWTPAGKRTSLSGATVVEKLPYIHWLTTKVLKVNW